jgi:hypothetical protein
MSIFFISYVAESFYADLKLAARIFKDVPANTSLEEDPSADTTLTLDNSDTA